MSDNKENMTPEMGGGKRNRKRDEGDVSDVSVDHSTGGRRKKTNGGVRKGKKMTEGGMSHKKKNEGGMSHKKKTQGGKSHKKKKHPTKKNKARKTHKHRR